MRFILAAALLALVGQAAAASAQPAPQPPAKKGDAPPPQARIAQSGSLTPAAIADLKDPTGKTIGRAFFYEGPRGMLMRIEAGQLTAGWHGVHIHAKGLCEGPKFESAGGHYNPDGKSHGLLHPQGAEAGDLPSFFVEASGVGRTSLYTDLVSARGTGGRPALLDADGSSVVIHAGPDDQSTQPSGGSGDRVACGVIMPAPVAPAR